MSRTARLLLVPGLLAWSVATLAQPAAPEAAATDPDEVAAAPEDGTAEEARDEQAQDEESPAPAEGKPDGPADEEFTPSEEISEDYAVPLPSDI
jgi:hypothetical protein